MQDDMDWQDDMDEVFDIDMDELDAMVAEQRQRLDHTLKLEVEHFTDPLCGWCYCMEPASTMLKFRLGDKLDYHYTLGLMVPDVRQSIGYGIEGEQRFNMMKQQLAYSYSIMEGKTGMPMSADHVSELVPEDIVTYNPSIAYEAIKLTEGPGSAAAFLKLLRQTAFAFDTPIGKLENVNALVESSGVNMEAYNQAVDSGRAKKELDGEIDRCHSMGVDVFPTLLITYGSVHTVVSGYQSPEDLVEVVEQLTDGHVDLEAPEYSKERAMELVDRFERISEEEMRAAFDLAPEDLEIAVGQLYDEQLIDITICSGSFFITRK